MIPQDSLAHDFSEDLPWLAFLYVSEDLTPDEAADFEERLLSDHSAREAVALAMMMTEGLWMASAMDSLTPKAEPAEANVLQTTKTARRKSPWLSWLASSVALAGLAFFVGWWTAHQMRPPRSRLRRSPNFRPSMSFLAKFRESFLNSKESGSLWKSGRIRKRSWRTC